MKKICQTLWEKDPFKSFVIFSRLRDKVHTFYPILLKLAWIVCIFIDIDPFKNDEKIHLIVLEKETFEILNFYYFIYM